MSRESRRLEPTLYAEIVKKALAEDLGRAGDLTTDAVVPRDTRGMARIVSRQSGRVAGVEIALAVFRALDPAIEATVVAPDGSDVLPGDLLLEIGGAAAPLLTGERTALNFLGHLSGVATATRAMVEAVEGTGAEITCTRKTTPGLRALEKYAVRIGGGRNHRFGLDDAVLIKDNHLAVAGGAGEAVRRARSAAGHLIKIEVEVETLEQLDEALASGADAVLLDNMPLETLRAAVARAKGFATLEASGGIDASSVRAVAETGVDLISSGSITHSAPALDLSMELEIERVGPPSAAGPRSAPAPVAES
jgi:nicotinate-nucleotide pyrophosphorylase (carboxylating)